MRKVFTLRLMIGIIITLVILVQLGYFAALRFVPVDTLDITQTPVIDNPGKSVTAGQPIQYHYTYCKHVKLEAQTSKVIIGAINYPLAVLTGNLPKGCGRAASSNTVIPSAVLPGNYRLQFTVTYQVNPLRTETVVFASEYFNVTAPGDTAASTGPTVLGNQTSMSETTRTPQTTPTSSTTDATTENVSPVPTQSAAPPPSPAPSPGLLQSLFDSILNGAKALL